MIQYKGIVFATAVILALLLTFNYKGNEMSGIDLSTHISFEQTNQDSHSTNGVSAEVLNNQPRLHIDPQDEERNGEPLEIRYCIHNNEAATYYTYVYVWTFSDSARWAEWLGYPDHGWDYEPIIVRIDNQTRQARYIYDKGHYLAGITQNRDFTVEKGSHRFTPSSSNGKIFTAANFKAITPGQLKLMNNALAGLSSLPFGRELSLYWACNDPEKVAIEGSFSNDTNVSHAPVQVNALGGVSAGVAAGLVTKAVAPEILANVSLGRIASIGAVSGLAGGVVGGIVSNSVHNSTTSKTAGIAAGILTGAATGVLVSIAIIRALSGMVMKSSVVIGGLCGAIASLLTSVW